MNEKVKLVAALVLAIWLFSHGVAALLQFSRSLHADNTGHPVHAFNPVHIPALPPRKAWLLIGWDSGDQLGANVTAAILLSSLAGTVTLSAYVCVALACCHRRPKRDQAKSVDALAVGRLGKMDERSVVLNRSKLWTVHNKRYDLRSYVASHPGGTGAINLGRGRNCTELFESYHSLANERLVRSSLARYYVEDVRPEDPDYSSQFNWDDTPFYSALKERFRAYFEAEGRSLAGHRAGLRQWAHLLFFVALSGVALAGAMRGQALHVLLLPFAYWWGPSPCMHDGGHFALSKCAVVNEMLGHLGDAHMSQYAWCAAGTPHRSGHAQRR
jgi:hypothetical protein